MTLMVSRLDGGPLDLQESGGNNDPLRGGKYSEFEGRVCSWQRDADRSQAASAPLHLCLAGWQRCAVLSSRVMARRFLPEHVRGTQQSGLMHIADWYATFTSMVGVNPWDERWGGARIDPHSSCAAPPSPVCRLWMVRDVHAGHDSSNTAGLNMWPLLSGQTTTSPRAELPVSNFTYINGQVRPAPHALWHPQLHSTSSCGPPRRLWRVCVLPLHAIPSAAQDGRGRSTPTVPACSTSPSLSLPTAPRDVWCVVVLGAGWMAQRRAV